MEVAPSSAGAAANGHHSTAGAWGWQGTLAQRTTANGSSGGASSGQGLVERLHPGRIVAGLLLLGLAALTYKHAKNGDLDRFVLQVQKDPYGTLHLFVAFHIFSVVVLFPVMLMQVLSGALYGFYMGLLITWVSSCAGQCLAFLLGRYLLRRSVKSYLLQRVPNFPQIEAAVKKEGWKLMCLLRLSPILPYNILNYAAALTPISFLSFSLSSGIAVIPWTCLYTYLGTFSTSVVDLVRGKVNYRAQHSTPGMQFLSSLLYMSLLGVTIVYGYVLSRRAMTSLLKSVADQEQPELEDTGQGGSGGGGMSATEHRV